ncbi:MAG: hypothetical protein K2O89_07075 [Clostridia bacterium]|nr:hypothetical protein [Clostridia bacterium]
MDDLKHMARAAKNRLKSNYWADCKENIEKNASEAKIKGISEIKAKSSFKSRVKSEIKGEKQDDFYKKVKEMLEAEGEVSDALGRLTDKDYYAKLSYEEKQRYNLELSSKYLNALQRYKKEKEAGII